MFLVLSLLENYAKKNHNCIPVAVLLTTLDFMTFATLYFKPQNSKQICTQILEF